MTQIRKMDERSEAPVPQQVLKVGPLRIRPSGRTATLNGKPLKLGPKEFDVLTLLAQHAGEAVSRRFLFEHAWDSYFSGDARLVDVHIMKLRRKLGEDARLIQTVPTVGYRLAKPKCPKPGKVGSTPR